MVVVVWTGAVMEEVMKDVHILRKGHIFKESQQDVRQGES